SSTIRFALFALFIAALSFNCRSNSESIVIWRLLLPSQRRESRYSSEAAIVFSFQSISILFRESNPSHPDQRLEWAFIADTAYWTHQTSSVAESSSVSNRDIPEFLHSGTAFRTSHVYYLLSRLG